MNTKLQSIKICLSYIPNDSKCEQKVIDKYNEKWIYNQYMENYTKSITEIEKIINSQIEEYPNYQISIGLVDNLVDMKKYGRIITRIDLSRIITEEELQSFQEKNQDPNDVLILPIYWEGKLGDGAFKNFNGDTLYKTLSPSEKVYFTFNRAGDKKNHYHIYAISSIFERNASNAIARYDHEEKRIVNLDFRDTNDPKYLLLIPLLEENIPFISNFINDVLQDN